MLASGPLKILAAYLSPSRPQIEADLSAFQSGGLPVLMAGDLNAKHVDWNSRLIKTRGRHLRDFTKNLVIPVYLTTCSALSSDHLPILIDTRCRSSFLNLQDRPDFRRTDWVKFQACLEDSLPPTPKLLSGVEIDTCV
jgi:hypothetical protein